MFNDIWRIRDVWTSKFNYLSFEEIFEPKPSDCQINKHLTLWKQRKHEYSWPEHGTGNMSFIGASAPWGQTSIAGESWRKNLWHQYCCDPQAELWQLKTTLHILMFLFSVTFIGISCALLICRLQTDKLRSASGSPICKHMTYVDWSHTLIMNIHGSVVFDFIWKFCHK